ncbi:carboxymuconolactone decarboxylase family protein [Nocardioides aquiterrae]|uniref:Carboxymuconolactone decarboxylase family protein n=1 Tax=Nocardioides aquiterrae TaxID=203799 RepID=A0ABP4EXD4_9ACTN
MSARLHSLKPGELDADQQALYDSIAGGDRAKGTQHFPLRAPDGSLNGPFGVMLHAPGVSTSLQELGATIRYRTSLTARVREIAILMVARAVQSDFEWWAHERVARAVGLTDVELQALAASQFTSADPAEQAAADLCAGLLSGKPFEDAAYAELVARLGVTAIIEVTTLVGYYRTLADLMRTFDVGVPDTE